MKMLNFIEGLQILQPLYDNDEFRFGCEHDQFFAYKTDRPLPEGDAARMTALGWFQSETKGDNYDPEDGWSCWT